MARSPAGLLCPAESALGPFFEEEPMVQPSQHTKSCCPRALGAVPSSTTPFVLSQRVPSFFPREEKTKKHHHDAPHEHPLRLQGNLQLVE